jgi:dephospho-CoA kinase
MFAPHVKPSEDKFMKIVGLTGGIASGKSTVAKMFEEQHIDVIDADFVYKELSKVGGLLYNDIVSRFGSDILLPNKEIHFALLGKKAFADPALLKELGEMTHPVVRKAVIRLIEEHRQLGKPIVIVSVPLLYESGFDSFCDEVIVVYSTLSTQVSRLMNRDLIDRSFALQKIGSQWPLKKKSKLADFVIDNSYTIEQTRVQTNQIINQLRG